MPIRKRLSDPYGDSIVKFENRLKYGAPPPTPKKPSLKEREAFVRSINTFPLGEMLDRRTFFRKYSDRYMTERFNIWGQVVYLLPLYKFLDDETVEVTGCAVGRHNMDRRGVCPRHRLQGDKRTWYSQTLHWIEETVYDG